MLEYALGLGQQRQAESNHDNGGGGGGGGGGAATNDSNTNGGADKSKIALMVFAGAVCLALVAGVSYRLGRKAGNQHLFERVDNTDVDGYEMQQHPTMDGDSPI